MADEESIDGDQVAGVEGLDVVFAEFRRKPLQQPDLVVAEFGPPVRDALLQAQQALIPGQQLMAAPHSAHAAGRHLGAVQHLLVADPERAVAGMRQAVVEDHGLDLGRHPVWVRLLRPAGVEDAPQPPGLGASGPVEQDVAVDQPVRPERLLDAPDLAELPSLIADGVATIVARDISAGACRRDSRPLLPPGIIKSAWHR